MNGVIFVGAVLLLFFGVGTVSASGVTPEDNSVQGMIRRVAGERGQSAALMLAFAKRESNFNAMAQNPSDPSFGLFGIEPAWLTYFGYSPDTWQLMDGPFSASLACDIIFYFQNKGFVFPSQADIYNVGETLWAKGVRNVAYRDAIIAAYHNF